MLRPHYDSLNYFSADLIDYNSYMAQLNGKEKEKYIYPVYLERWNKWEH